MWNSLSATRRTVVRHKHAVLLSLITMTNYCAGNQVSVSCRPEKPVIASGEPCLMIVTVQNDTARQQTIDFGTDGTEAFRFEVRSMDGETICSSSHIKLPDVSAIGRVTIEARGTVERRLVLNEWCTTSSPAGRYSVVCVLRLGDAEQRATSELVIEAADEFVMTRLFRELSVVALGTDPVERRFQAGRLITSSSSPFAVPALSRLIFGSTDPQVRLRAIDALGRIGTLDAVDELVTIVQLKGEGMRSLQLKAIANIKSLERSSSDPRIREMCRRELEVLSGEASGK